MQDRFEMFVLELDEEKFRLIQTFIWISAIVFAGMMALTFASLTIVYLFWERARFAALGGMALLYTAALLALGLAFRRFLARRPRPFAATLATFTADRGWIHDAN